MIEERKVKRPGLVRVSDPGDLDVRSIRLNAGSIGCTRKNFAAAIGVSVKTPRNWEQRRRRPNAMGHSVRAAAKSAPGRIA
jgi:DNA-binding transcriptional regulator YiaG